MKKPIIAIAGLTACSGCQLTLLNCEEELPEIARRFIIDYFPLGFTERLITGPIDMAIVEGAVSTPSDLEILMKLRNCSRSLVALGTCALWGGIAAMKNQESRKDLAETVYGSAADKLKTFNPQPLHRFVKIDFAITGCPPEKGELLATLAAMLREPSLCSPATRSAPSAAAGKISVSSSNVTKCASGRLFRPGAMPGARLWGSGARGAGDRLPRPMSQRRWNCF